MFNIVVLPNLVQNSTDSRSTGSKSEISTSKPSTSSSRKSSIDMKKYSPFLKNYMGNDVCKLKVFGLENEPFLLELVRHYYWFPLFCHMKIEFFSGIL